MDVVVYIVVSEMIFLSNRRPLAEYRSWYMKSFKPALDKLLKQDKITKYHYDRLNDPVSKYQFTYKETLNDL